jgi:hypothetical protein
MGFSGCSTRIKNLIDIEIRGMISIVGGTSYLSNFHIEASPSLNSGEFKKSNRTEEPGYWIGHH